MALDIPAIFEVAIKHGGVISRVVILQRRWDGRCRLIEVKSTTDIKDHHLDVKASAEQSNHDIIWPAVLCQA